MGLSRKSICQLRWRKIYVRIRSKWSISFALKHCEQATSKLMIKWNLKRESRKSSNLSSKFKANSSIREKILRFRNSFLKQWQALSTRSMESSPKRLKPYSQTSRITSRPLSTNSPSYSKASKTKGTNSLLRSGMKSGLGMNSLKLWSKARIKSSVN